MRSQWRAGAAVLGTCAGGGSGAPPRPRQSYAQGGVNRNCRHRGQPQLPGICLTTGPCTVTMDQAKDVVARKSITAGWSIVAGETIQAGEAIILINSTGEISIMSGTINLTALEAINLTVEENSIAVNANRIMTSATSMACWQVRCCTRCRTQKPSMSAK